MALVRRDERFHRFCFSICYDGSHFLGVSHQGQNENCITKEGTDLRALHSIEGRIKCALRSLVDGSRDYSCQGPSDGQNFENFQISSRTDRGVHAIHNTFHVDVRSRNDRSKLWEPKNLVRGLNFHLIRSAGDNLEKIVNEQKEKNMLRVPPNLLRTSKDSLRITSANLAPVELLPNKHYNEGTDSDSDEPSHIDWNARFTAISRTYVYRIIADKMPSYEKGNDESDSDDDDDDDSDHSNIEEYGLPFETGKSWRIRCRHEMDKGAMEQAAAKLVGTHDFSSFRGKGCYRSSAITTIESIAIHSAPLLSSFMARDFDDDIMCDTNNSQLITVTIKGNAFLYRQVRNIVGCLAEVGIGSIPAKKVESILNAKDRRSAPRMAPAHGLYLAHVEHFPSWR